MDYQIEIKQIVDYPRCRIYRSFLEILWKIGTSGQTEVPIFLLHGPLLVCELQKLQQAH